MERYNEDLVLKTSDVADLLSIHPSTVKRWCNDGDLPADTTDGGHRRMHLEDVLKVARERDVPTFLDGFDPYQGHVWSAVSQARSGRGFGRVHDLAMGWLSRGHLERVGRLFEVLGHLPEVAFPAFLDHGVRGFMDRVGRAWREGRLRIGEEHLASQAMIETLLRLRSSRHLGLDGHPSERPNALSAAARQTSLEDRLPGLAIVGTIEGSQHHLGALAVRLLLERAGWKVLYLGADVPVEDFAHLQKAHGARLVCVSFAPPAGGADVGRCVRVLSEFHSHTRPYALALGGNVGGDDLLPARRTPFTDLGLFETCVELQRHLDEGFGRSRYAATAEAM